MRLKENYFALLERIEHICKDTRRKSEEITLVAVTKGISPDKINKAIEHGIKIIGENRIQEAEKKFPLLLPVQKHFIGHLQTNKVKKAVQLFDCIQSVDRVKLAQEIDKHCAQLNKQMLIMLEVNISGEAQKQGFASEKVKEVYHEMKKLKHITVIGLMGIAPNIEPEKTRPYFRKLKHLCKELNLKHCSMGMSQDFEVAIEEGSTMIRIGRALFQT